MHVCELYRVHLTREDGDMGWERRPRSMHVPCVGCLVGGGKYGVWVCVGRTREERLASIFVHSLEFLVEHEGGVVEEGEW